MKTKKPVIFLTFANDKVDDALYLRNLPLELNGIRNALDQAVKSGLCEVVERTAATVDDIFNTFQDPYYADRIAVFHYGGHASGSQLMLETLDGGHGASNSEGLVPFLGKQKGLKCVFFNGCSTQQQSLELSEAGVPAVIGTATAIKDTIATELSTRFYNGLATGSTLHEAWLEAIDIVKTKNTTKKRKGLKLRRDKSEDFPWELKIREGAEIVKDWNLPNAVNNPMFGMPELPKLDLPESPFLFLRRYEPKHAEIFFGRDTYIRQLYDRITSDKAAPVILFYGQSGAGKSSTLASGLLPRLQQEADVKYVRRDSTIGLLGTLDKALGGNLESSVVRVANGNVILVSELKQQIQQLDKLKPSLEKTAQQNIDALTKSLNTKLASVDINIKTDDAVSRLERWLKIEEETGRPFHILLDQVEETFTRYNPDLKDELENLLIEIQMIFASPTNRPKGKIILSYRKEYNPEIEELCKKVQLPREKIFLKKLQREDIMSVVYGVESTERLANRYKIKIDPNLPEIIADDLLEDKDSPIAPVLSILLTKLWQLAEKEATSVFSVELYQNLKKEGILMADFFQQQMKKVKEWQPDLEESGLALDILNFHTTELGTAGRKTLDNIQERYKHKSNEIDKLIVKFKQLYLLTDAGTNATGLAHDTLAPIVKNELRESDKSGQRAYRILTSKLNEFEEDRTNLLDATDLGLVENGKDGMRLWTELEQQLVKASRARRARQKRLRRILIGAGAVAVLAIIGLSFWALSQRRTAEGNFMAAQSIATFAEQDYTSSLSYSKAALNIKSGNTDAYNVLLKSKYAHIYPIEDKYYSTPTKDLSIIDFDAPVLAENAKTLTVAAIEAYGNNYEIVVKQLSGDTTTIRFPLKYEGEEPINVKISPDGKFVSAVSVVETDSLLVCNLWSVKDKSSIFTTERHMVKWEMSSFLYDNYNEIEMTNMFSASGKYFVSSNGNSSKQTTVVNLKNGEQTTIPSAVSFFTMNNLFKPFAKNILSEDEKYIICGDGKMYDLDRSGTFVHHFTSDENSLYSGGLVYFTDDGKQVVYAIEYDKVELFSVATKEKLFSKSIVYGGAGLQSIGVISGNGKYLLTNITIGDEEESKTATVIEVASGREIFNADGAIQGLFTMDAGYAGGDDVELLFVNKNGNTILYNVDIIKSASEQVQSLSEQNFKGEFVYFSAEKELVFTNFNENTTYIWDVNSRNAKPLLVLHGAYSSSKLNDDYYWVSTASGVYDLKQNYYPVGITNDVPHDGFEGGELFGFFSADGQQLIYDDGEEFTVRDIFTGKPLDIAAADELKNGSWKDHKTDFYEPLMKGGIINLEMKSTVGNEYNSIYIFDDAGKIYLRNKENNDIKASFPILGKDIFHYHFKAEGRMIEVISGTSAYFPLGDYTIYTQSFWIDQDFLMEY